MYALALDLPWVGTIVNEHDSGLVGEERVLCQVCAMGWGGWYVMFMIGDGSRRMWNDLGIRGAAPILLRVRGPFGRTWHTS